MVSVAQKEFTQIYPRAGWVEHDAMEIWSTQMGVAQEASLKINGTNENIEAIGITNQRRDDGGWDEKPAFRSATRLCGSAAVTADYCGMSWKRPGTAIRFVRRQDFLIGCLFQRQLKPRWILENIRRQTKRRSRRAPVRHHRETWLIWKLNQAPKVM